MINPGKELLQVKRHNHPPSGLHVALRGQNRILRTSPRPESLAMLTEGGVQNRLKHLQQCLLN